MGVPGIEINGDRSVPDDFIGWTNRGPRFILFFLFSFLFFPSRLFFGSRGARETDAKRWMERRARCATISTFSCKTERDRKKGERAESEWQGECVQETCARVRLAENDVDCCDRGDCWRTEVEERVCSLTKIKEIFSPPPPPPSGGIEQLLWLGHSSRFFYRSFLQESKHDDRLRDYARQSRSSISYAEWNRYYTQMSRYCAIRYMWHEILPRILRFPTEKKR